MENKIERLKKIIDEIDLMQYQEYYFDKLYKLLTEEYGREKNENPHGVYCNNLRQTIEKEAQSYRSEKRRKPKKGALHEYRDFVANFKLDVFKELTRIKADK